MLPLGVSLKKKQLWMLEPADRDLICFKSHLNKYLAVDQVGVVITSIAVYCVVYCTFVYF